MSTVNKLQINFPKIVKQNNEYITKDKIRINNNDLSKIDDIFNEN